MEHQIQKRDIGIVVLLSLVTLSIYYIYLMARWAGDINSLLNRTRHRPVLIVVVGICTLLFALIIWEIVYAYDLQRITEKRNTPGRNRALGSYVLILNIISAAVAVLSGGLAFIVSVGVGIWAYCLIQKELNLIVDQGNAEMLVA
jgi:uncharacterized membrane protein